ncbi:MAG: YigZ family protein [Bacilli bacterium]|nr:YigZ family protein [Bacilli bacterium]
MKLLNESIIEIKKSKFIGLYYEISSQEEAKEIIENLKKEHKKARHIPYAYKVNNTAKKSDDKEPSNTAGLPIYNIIERKNLDNCLIAVVRYFGGVKLGAGGLLRAYSDAANQACTINSKI